METAETRVETHRFQAEVSQVLHLVINSLYSHKEVFLRELVSNASDALDKLKFRALTEPGLMGDDSTLEVRISVDKEAKTITIADTGVGMTHDELVENLGTIAHSGSKKFLEAIKAKGGSGDVSLIGQFGVGFYSAWLVAEHVDVISRAAGSDTAWRWTSHARDSFTVEPAEREHRGTSVVLHVREDQDEFLELWRLRELVTRYSDFVGHPILVQNDKGEFETANKASALWQRPKSEVTKDQYEEFYRHVARAYDEPLAWTHFRVEGTQEFVGLLFIPTTPPFDLDAQQGESRRGVQLFVKRVVIMDNCEAIVPTWLRFVRGVLDSDDLPLNVSRETLQDSGVVRAIRKQVAKKTLDLLDEVAKDRPDDYATFWGAFGRILKEGLVDDYRSGRGDDRDFKERIAKLVRFESSKGEGLTSLVDYVGRMPEGQEAIYYAIGENVRAVADSPHLEGVKKKGFEVIFLTDPVDTWAVEGLREFQGKKLVSVTDANLKVDASDEEKKDLEEKSTLLRSLFDRARAVLGGRVKEVRASERLTDSPACLVLAPGSITPAQERVMRALGREVPAPQRILEVNPTHPLVEGLRAVAERDSASPQVAEWIEVLYDQALLTEGTPIDDPQRFARRLTTLLTQAVTSAASQTAAQ
ncbi:MAG: molecular chaperone HtpG [Polyangiales bacterium]